MYKYQVKMLISFGRTWLISLGIGATGATGATVATLLLLRQRLYQHPTMKIDVNLHKSIQVYTKSMKICISVHCRERKIAFLHFFHHSTQSRAFFWSRLRLDQKMALDWKSGVMKKDEENYYFPRRTKNKKTLPKS